MQPKIKINNIFLFKDKKKLEHFFRFLGHHYYTRVIENWDVYPQKAHHVAAKIKPPAFLLFFEVTNLAGQLFYPSERTEFKRKKS